ncbi:MAG TPA: hypothetical protein VNC78_08890 [Actinomycetota bacterium]|nr:hypothetical protein [Actinomycetota bacterium]
MTAQAHDGFLWQNGEYLLVGVDGGRLFDLREHGFETRPTTTANWRGWVARYGIIEDQLLLVELRDVGLWVEPGDPPPVLRGVEGILEGHSYRFHGLVWPLDFSGRLLIARGFIQSLYRHMGFHPAWKFEEAWQLEINEGRLVEAHDTSDEMRATREKIGSDEAADPDDVTRPGWIARTFRLSFNRSKIDGD